MVEASPPYKSYSDVFASEEYSKLQVFEKSILSDEQMREYKRRQLLTRLANENCVVKALKSGIGGGVLGTLFGCIFQAVKFGDGNLEVAQQSITQLYKGWGREIASSAKAFAAVGCAYSFFECVIQGRRAKQDLVSTLLTGCTTGGALGWRGSIAGMASGCVGFAAFSMIIEKWQHSQSGGASRRR